MLLTHIKSVSFATVCLLLGSTGVQAAADGSLGLTSTGEVGLSVMTPQDPATAQVQISGLTDIDMGTLAVDPATNVFSTAAQNYSVKNICIYGDYLDNFSLDISSANGGANTGGGVLKPVGSPAAAGFTYLYDFAMGNQAPTWKTGSQQNTVFPAIKSSPDCAGETHNTLGQLYVSDIANDANDTLLFETEYVDTLTLTVTPQ